MKDGRGRQGEFAAAGRGFLLLDATMVRGASLITTGFLVVVMMTTTKVLLLLWCWNVAMMHLGLHGDDQGVVVDCSGLLVWDWHFFIISTVQW